MVLPLPGFDHGLLHQVLRIRFAPALLAGKEQQSGSVVKNPTFPIRLFRRFIYGTAVHAISTGKAPPSGFFV
jgi:hypothetical protein